MNTHKEMRIKNEIENSKLGDCDIFKCIENIDNILSEKETTPKIYIDNSHLIEFISDIVNELVECKWGEQASYIEEENGDMRYTEEAQNQFNSDYDRIETLLNNLLGVYSNNEVEEEKDEFKRDKEIQEAKQLLEDNGFQTYNLWHVDDVKSKFKCNDSEAMEVLRSALTNEATMEQIWYALEHHGKELI